MLISICIIQYYIACIRMTFYFLPHTFHFSYLSRPQPSPSTTPPYFDADLWHQSSQALSMPSSLSLSLRRLMWLMCFGCPLMRDQSVRVMTLRGGAGRGALNHCTSHKLPCSHFLFSCIQMHADSYKFETISLWVCQGSMCKDQQLLTVVYCTVNDHRNILHVLVEGW